MAHRTRKYRASRAVDKEGKPLITTALPIPRTEPVTAKALREYQPPEGRPRGPMAQMLKQTKGARKWLDGIPVIHYARQGYEWVQGKYIGMPRATGITHKYRTNRAGQRAQIRAGQHPGIGQRYERGETRPLSRRAVSKRNARKAWAQRKQAEPLSVAYFEQARKRARLVRARG